MENEELEALRSLKSMYRDAEAMQWLNGQGRAVRFEYDAIPEKWVVIDIMGNKGTGENLTDAIMELRQNCYVAAVAAIKSQPTKKPHNPMGQPVPEMTID